MIAQLLCRDNLNRAYLQVYRNKGSSGVDGMEVSTLSSHLNTHEKRYTDQIANQDYKVSPILGIEIPKSNGKSRLLGIPTVVDRVFQQALHQVLQPLFEPDFSKHSYGFRPRRAHQAVRQSLLTINSGKRHIVDIDLRSFFDEVDWKKRAK